MADNAPNSEESILPDHLPANCERLSATELDRQLDELSLDVPPLPADFSRADIYLDHD
jgi:hypothetical protein